MNDKVLKFNSIENSNDPNEYKNINPSFVYDPINYPISSSEDMYNTGQQLNQIIKKTKMICFSTNEFGRTSRTVNEGWNLPRMWHSYGDLHRGICIEIKNNDSFLNENSNIFMSPTVFRNPVNYKKDLTYPILKKGKFESEDEAKNFIIENSHQYFFQKHIDWSGEREYRIISLDSTVEFINFKNSVEKIVLGERCPNIYIPLLKNHFRGKLYKITFDENKRIYKLKYL
jgi:hypothetical protein